MKSFFDEVLNNDFKWFVELKKSNKFAEVKNVLIVGILGGYILNFGDFGFLLEWLFRI